MDRLLDRPASPRIHRGFSSKLNRELVALTMLETAYSGESVITHRAASSGLIGPSRTMVWGTKLIISAQ